MNNSQRKYIVFNGSVYSRNFVGIFIIFLLKFINFLFSEKKMEFHLFIIKNVFGCCTKYNQNY